MVMYGSVLGCMGVYGDRWRFIVMHRGVWRCIVVYGNI